MAITTHQPLYQAQAAAMGIFREGLPQNTFQSIVSNGFSTVDSGIRSVSSRVDKTFGCVLKPIGKVGYDYVGVYVQKVVDAVFPINPINGHRHVILIPREFEKFLGEWVFYPIAKFGLMRSHEMLKHDPKQESIADRVNQIVRKLAEQNEDLLNPEGCEPFRYRAETVMSPDMNAFATPGGGMVVFNALVRELSDALQSKSIKETIIKMPNGKRETVDLKGVNLNDVLAALLGHEMTHVASRHGIFSKSLELVGFIISKIVACIFVTLVKQNDSEYQRLQKQNTFSPLGNPALESREYYYSKLYGILDRIREHVTWLFSLSLSKSHEYEADVTGMYFAARAEYNPLGALYLQEFFEQKEDYISAWLHRNLELLFKHPCYANRKLALLGAVQSLKNQPEERHPPLEIVIAPESRLL